MNRLSSWVMILALFAATFAVIRGGAQNSTGADHEAAAWQATNVAFRDGLYLGKLAAARGDSFRLSHDRWADENDRNAFALGYERGYNELMAKK